MESCVIELTLELDFWIGANSDGFLRGTVAVEVVDGGVIEVEISATDAFKAKRSDELGVLDCEATKSDESEGDGVGSRRGGGVIGALERRTQKVDLIGLSELHVEIGLELAVVKGDIVEEEL